jgi:hypothetical protein
VRPQAKHHEVQDRGREIEDGANHHGCAIIVRQSPPIVGWRDYRAGRNICGRQDRQCDPLVYDARAPSPGVSIARSRRSHQPHVQLSVA